MFSALRQNSLVYILDKAEAPVLKKGLVISVTAPRSKANTLYTQPMNMVVDIEINVEGSREVFKDIPANLSIVTDANIVLSESREAMCTEVESMLATSKQVLESVEYHEGVVNACDEMLKLLSPQFAKEKEQEAKINVLESKVTGIETSLSDIKAMLSQALTNKN